MAEFEVFATPHNEELLRLARVLTADRAPAEDAVQEALVGVCSRDRTRPVEARPVTGHLRRRTGAAVRAGSRDPRWAHLAAVTVLTILMSSCGSQASRSGALDDAEHAARDRVQEHRTAYNGLLKELNSDASIERALGEGNPAVFDITFAGNSVTWGLVVVGEGFSGGGVGELSQGVRACVRLTGVVGRGDITVKDTACPPGPEASQGLPSYNETRRLYD